MNLTNTQRVIKLARNLMANPDLVMPYLQMSIFNRKLPIDIGMPWWTFRVIERADGFLAGKRVFEYGTGGSTLRYAKIAKQIVSVEDDKAWMNLVRDRLAKENISNVEILLYGPSISEIPSTLRKENILQQSTPQYGML